MDFTKQAEDWIAIDPDPETRAELTALLGDPDALAERFGERLNFGTAGLRGELGAGPNRMNRVVVAQAALGLSNYLGGKGLLVIGFDGRVNSDIFARDTAELAAAAGLEVLLFDRMVPTPVLAFAVKPLGAAAGVMVTASHNPPRDNGYKVYLGGANGGGQIISPTDAEIQAEILKVAASSEPWARSDDYQTIGDDVIEAYLARVLEITKGRGAIQPKIVYTAMHGVGWAFAKELFERAGYTDVHSVAEQQEPDGRFPTVAFPNPEEPGALDLALELFEKLNADLILANDPDADRLAVVVRDHDGKPKRLTGNEVGLILGEMIAIRSVSGSLACSMVSSDQLALVAKRYNLDFAQTNTGFKWISKVPGLVFGFEEALGYCIDPQVVPDKDGISAAMAIALLASDAPVRDFMTNLARNYGDYATDQVSVRFNSVAEARQAFERATAGMPEADGMVIWAPNDGEKVTFRVSGTEPKLKCYLQVSGEDADERLAELEQSLRKLLV
ncbi:MAG: phospho-sugar mutase [Rhodoluna sp.]|nr:phospho-sugar mutase [Rhodoluna sp.]